MSKTLWRTLSFPQKLIDRIKKVAHIQGYVSLAEYAREAIRKRLEVDENAIEETKMLEKEIKERLKD